MAKVKNPNFSKIDKNNPLIYSERKNTNGFTHNVRIKKMYSKHKKNSFVVNKKTNNKAIVIFEDKPVRRLWNEKEEKWYFSVAGRR